jgi:hypothetical protein
MRRVTLRRLHVGIGINYSRGSSKRTRFHRGRLHERRELVFSPEKAFVTH